MSISIQIFRWISTFLICALILFLLSFFKFDLGNNAQSADSTPIEYPEIIEASQVKQVTWRPSIKLLGEVVAPQFLELRNELGGRIIALNLSSGGQIKKGQKLLRLDTSEEQAQLKNVQAKAELASLELKRSEKLLKTKMVSMESVDKIKADLKVNQAEIQAVKAIINKKTLLAPFDGHVGLHGLEIGQYISANTLITSMVGIKQHLWVDFKVPQQYSQVAAQAMVTILSENGQNKILGQIVAHNPVLNPNSRTLQYRARINNQDNRMKQGQIVEVLFPTSSVTQVTKIPTSAIVREPFSDYVYTLSPADDGASYISQKRVIKVAQQEQQYSLVLSGLNKDELVVSSGAFKLRPGKLVAIKPSTEISQNSTL